VFKHWFNRYKALKHIHFEGEKSRLFFHKNVWFYCEKNSKILIRNGLVQIGYGFPGRSQRPSYDKAVITLKEGATLILGGGTHISHGVSIHVGRDGKMILAGKNWVANNCTFICSNELTLGHKTSLSWNVTLIDDDERVFFRADGTPIQSASRKLIIGDNVGLMMNVVIPKGVTIGENAVIGANTVVRRDIPDNCLVYQNPEMKIRYDTTVGLQNLE